MKVNNLRPTRPQDSLDWLLNRVDQDHTVPFGQKAASASEGINYRTSDGSKYRWDGDTVADYDRRIREGQEAVEDATSHLVETEHKLSDARDRISSVESDTTPGAIGDTAADQINGRKLLVGRDAILTGTVDVAQLNVTEELSAEVVEAMSVEAKKLVVTEDAILNRATVVESLVTPELVAERIDVKRLGADMVTAGAIQTDTGERRGMKITDDGIEGYDESGAQTMRIDGKNNLLVGDLATAPQSATGVKITSRGSLAAVDFYSDIESSSSYSPHGAAWFDAPSGNITGSALHLGATVNQDMKTGDPEIILAPLQKGIAFNSKFLNGQAMKFGTVESKLDSGQWVDLDVKFGDSMPDGGSVLVFISPITEGGGECAVGVKEADRNGFKAVVKNVSNRDIGYAWVKWMAINRG